MLTQLHQTVTFNMHNNANCSDANVTYPGYTVWAKNDTFFNCDNIVPHKMQNSWYLYCLNNVNIWY